MRNLLAPTLLVALLAGTAAAQEPNFGRALAANGNELFVGQPVNWYGPGTVYVYRADASGRWTERQRVIASDSARMDDFGRAIAAHGDVLAIGAPRKRDGAGAVYLFANTGGSPWRQMAVLPAPAGGQFGAAIALGETQLLVGAPAAEGGGAVYRWDRDGMTAPAEVLRAPGGGAQAGFGSTIALRDDALLIGAPGADSGAGAVYAYHRGTDGNWGQGTPLRLPRIVEAGGGRVGAALHLDGDRLYVGAPGAATVYVLTRSSDGSWQPAAELHPFDAPRGTQFGTAITTAGNEVWIGAPGVNGFNGTTYRFLTDGADARGALRFDADSADGTAWPFAFGYSLATANGQVAIGMPYRDFGEGRVLVAARQGDTWRERQQLTGEIYVLGGGPAASKRCDQGHNGVFTCNNVEVVAHLPTAALGGARGAWVNDVWGWTDPATRRDYALVARRDGASFVDVTDPAKPRLVGTLPRTVGSPPSVWRDIKTIGNHAYIVADGSGAHGVQVFDLTRLRRATGAPVTFAPDTTYHEIFSAHNIVADTASHFLYVVGSNSGGETCGGGLHIVDATRPAELRFRGCYNDKAGANPRGYTHDAQCVVYRGPDARYRGHQVCVGSNEKEINIADVTDKSRPVTIGRNSYPNVSYAHQGWFDDEQRFFYMNDENDEADGLVEGTRTIVWDLTQLDDPVVADMYIGPVKSSDHNLFVVGNRVYESNYGSGLRVLDISDRKAPREVAFFDSAPMNDDGPGHSATQSGAWSNYPFFKNGLVVFTSVREGLFLVKVQDLVP